MEIHEAIKKRRSIRKYKDKEVSREIIKELIKAARLAPSAYNAQPWRFKVVNDKNIINQLREYGVFKNEFVYKVPLIIACCGDILCYPDRAKENFDLKELAIADISFASQNLVLRATELGLGSCYIGLFNKEKIKKILEIPENYIIPYCLIIGYSDEEPAGPGRKSVNEIEMK
ncbi:MAG: nitroreductase family protein [Nanoarchaeota archaeon]